MRVAMDLSAVVGNVDGIGIYVQSLAQALLTMQENLEMIPIYGCMPSGRDMWIPDMPGVRRRPTYMPRRVYDYLVARGAPIEIVCGNADIVHWPNYSVHKSKRAKTVVTIHDLAFIEFPEMYGEEACTHYNALMQTALEHTDYIIADSKHAADSVVSNYGWPRSRISHVYLGGAELSELVSDRYKPPFESDGYILAVGSQVPRKNYDTLIKAFAMVKSALQQADIKLVFVGKSGSATQQLRELAHELQVSESIVWLGYVTNEDKAGLYYNANCTVVCSWLEGFGIPVVEAMACGCPVVCSNVTSLPEVAGDAALMCSPSDTETLADNIHKVLTDVAVSSALVARSKQRCKDFTWSTCAQHTYDVYQHVISCP